MIYADNAATTKLDIDAFEAMAPYLLSEYGNASQPYSFSRSAKKAIKEARQIIANCINATPEEIYFTSGGTESDNWAIKGSAFYDQEKRETITSSIEHHALLQSCAAIERLGYPVTYIGVSHEGIVSKDELAKNISSKTRLVSVMLVNNEIGSVQPIQELCRIAHQYNAIFHTDAVQALGHIKVDVQELGVDMLSASAHKFNGPKGIGFLYIRNGTPIAPLSDGGAQEFGLRAGTENVAAIIGMAIALRKNCLQIDQHSAHLNKLEHTLLSRLNQAKLDYVRNGSIHHIPGNISLSFRNVSGESLLHRLDLMGICVSTGSACDNVNTRVSHVLQAIGLDEEYANGTIRISLSHENTIEEIIRIVECIIKILKVVNATLILDHSDTEKVYH